MRGCGCIERPAFPAPSDIRGRDVLGKPRAKHAARSQSRVWETAPPRQSIIHGIQVLTFVIPIAISTPPGTSGLLAFGLESQTDGIDTMERRPPRAPQPAVFCRPASRTPEAG